MSEIITVDASGLSCPQPVLLTKQAIRQAKQGTVVVLVDSGTSRDNCSRVAEKAGWTVAVEDRLEGGYRLVLSR